MQSERRPCGTPDERALLEALGHAVIVTDLEGRIELWNAAAEALYGWPAGEVLGRSVLELTPADTAALDATAIFTELQAGRSWSGEMLLRRADGSTFLGRITDSPVFDADGELVGIVGISEDVTARHQAEQALRRNQDRLRVALDAGRLGVWEWDVASDEVRWDATMEALFGLEPGTFDGSSVTYLARVHPDDREAVAAAFASDVTGTGRTLEHRVVWPDGTVRWIEGRGHVRRDEHGRITGVVGVATDATERHRVAERLELLASVSEALTETLDVDVRLERFVRLVVPRVADICAVFLVDDDAGGRPVLHAVRHTDPTLDEPLRAWAEQFPVRPDAPYGTAAALREGRTVRMPEIDPDRLAAAAAGDERIAVLARLGIRSSVVVPLVGRNGPIGSVAFATTDDRRLDDDDVALAEEVSARAATSIENALLVQVRARAEAQLRFQNALLEAQNEAGIEAVLVVGPEGDVLTYNQRFVSLWGLDDDVLARGSDRALLEQAASRVVDPAGFVAGVQAAYRTRTTQRDEVAFTDGRVVERHGAPLHGAEGEYFGWAWYFRDVTAERRSRAEVAAVGERFAALARTLQQSLLPPTLPSFPGIDLAARYHPAFEGLEVGGDFYDVFAVADAWMLVIGDVCGKGADAAALTALARYTIRAAAMHHRSPAGVLRELNAALLAHASETSQSRFVTVSCVRLEQAPGALHATVACGGHAPPLVLRADGTTEAAGTPGLLLGLFDEVDAEPTTVRLAPGDTLVAMTDGVMEARDVAGMQLDEVDLTGFFAELAGRPAAAVSEAIEQRALQHQSGVARDDIAVLVARVSPPS